MSDEKGKNSNSADDLAEKLFGINVSGSADAEVGDGLLFDDYDETDNSIEGLLGIGAPRSSSITASESDNDFDFDRAEQHETKSSKTDYADEIDDDLILFTDEDEDEDAKSDDMDDDDVEF